MKRLFIYTVMLMIALTSGAQKVKPVQYGGMCQLHSVKDKGAGIYVIACNGYGKNDAIAKEDAEIRVIRMVLYTGIAGERNALLREETEQLDNFIDQKQYKDYIMNITQAAPLIKDKGAKIKRGSFLVTVNVGGLDRYLKKNGLKKLGF